MVDGLFRRRYTDAFRLVCLSRLSLGLVFFWLKREAFSLSIKK